jgi:hypothetical protein
MAKTQFDSMDQVQFMNYAWPVTGFATITATSTSSVVALATIQATDVVLAQVVTTTTAGYVTAIAITAGTSFKITVSAATGSASISYAVFKANS